MKKSIQLKEVEKEFQDIEEEFKIKCINFSFVQDSHYDDFTLSVEIMGESQAISFLGESPVAEYTIDLEDLLTEEDMPGIAKKIIPILFDADLLEFLFQEKVKIFWNPDDEESCQTIDLQNLDDGYLLPMIR